MRWPRTRWARDVLLAVAVTAVAQAELLIVAPGPGIPTSAFLANFVIVPAFVLRREDDLLLAAVRAGACGYLLKIMAPEDIRDAVRAAADGRTALAPELIDRLLREHATSRAVPSPVLDRLTKVRRTCSAR